MTFFPCVKVYFVIFDKDFNDDYVEIRRTKCDYLDDFHGTGTLHYQWRYENKTNKQTKALFGIHDIPPLSLAPRSDFPSIYN